MKKLLSVAWMSAAIVLGAGVAAQAATIVTSTLTGTLRDGAYDVGNFFGGDINGGDAFTLKSVFSTPPGTYDPANGGSITGGGTATLTIKGHDYTFALDPNSFGLDQYGSVKLFEGDTNSTYLSAAFYPLTTLASITSPFSGACYDTPGGYCSGTFVIASNGYSGASFDATHLSIAVATTPIPAALPMLGTSLLGLGFFARRRKAARAAA